MTASRHCLPILQYNNSVQVDLIDFSGPAFPNVDNRVAALRLVQKELCDAALFDPSGTSLSSLDFQSLIMLRGFSSFQINLPNKTPSTCFDNSV